MPDATFAAPDLTTFCRLDELGLVAVGQRVEPQRAVIACRVVEPDDWWNLPASWEADTSPPSPPGGTRVTPGDERGSLLEAM